MEKEATKRLAPLMKRFEVPSRQEVSALSRRLAQLERKLEKVAKKVPATDRNKKS